MQTTYRFTSEASGTMKEEIERLKILIEKELDLYSQLYCR